MSTIDAPTQQQPVIAVPAPVEGPAPAGTPTRPRRYVGLHRATRGRHHTGAVQPVDVGHRLTPAARQLVAPTDEAVHAGPDDATGLLRLDDITNLGEDVTP